MIGPFKVNITSLLKIEREIKANEWEIIKLFKERYKILRKNLDDIGVKKISGGFNIDKNFCYSGSIEGLPNEFRLKGLYVDFRPFIHHKEDIFIPKFCDNLLKGMTSSLVFNKYIEDTKQKFISKNVLEGWIKYKESNIEARKIIDTWFYANLFHFNRKKELNKMLKYFTSDTFQSLLFLSVYDCILQIQKIHESISELDKEFPYLKIPNKYKNFKSD